MPRSAFSSSMIFVSLLASAAYLAGGTSTAQPKPGAPGKPAASSKVGPAPSASAVPVPSGSASALPPIPVPGVMIDIPAGELTDTTRSGRAKKNIAAFKLDRTEVTVAAYRACVDAKRCAEPLEDKDGANENCNYGYKKRPDHPVTCVAWSDADSYCKFLGARLPGRDEWLYAATGGDGDNYPWGATAPTTGVAGVCWSGAVSNNVGLTSTCRVGTSPTDVSPFKLVDMAANVQEWVSDPGTYMGGGYNISHPDAVKPAEEHKRPGPWGYNFIGFRCAK